MVKGKSVFNITYCKPANAAAWAGFMGHDKSISRIVNIYDPAQFPISCLGTDVKITVTNQHHLHVTRLKAGQQGFKLEVTEPELLGLVRFGVTHTDEFMQKIILACNLILKEALFSTSMIDPSPAEIVLENPPNTSKVEKTPAGSKIIISNVPLLRDTVVSTVDELDEAKVIDVLQNVHAVLGYGSKPPLKIHNLQKSLTAYGDGMQATSALQMFKRIYEAMELAVNFDGSNSGGSDLDKMVKHIIGDNTIPIATFRNFNNSTKHSSKDANRADYETGKANINRYTRTLRSITTTVILCRLKHASTLVKHVM